MSGGGGGGTTESTSYQTNLPEYAEPYYKELMARTQKESIQPFQPYGGDRIAGFSDTQQQAQQGIVGMQAPESLGQAESTLGEVGQSALQQSYDPTQFGTQYQASPYESGYQASQFDPGYQAGAAPETYSAGQITSPYQAMQFDPAYQASQFDPGYEAGTFDAETAEQYMDPYMRQVIDTQKREAQQEFQRSRAGTAAEAVQAGAFGGSRFGVREAEMESEYLDRLADIEAQGMQQAYQQGREQFGAEQAMQQQEAQMGMSAQQQEEAARQQQEQFAQAAEQMTEEDRQFAANMAQQVATSQEAADQFAAQYGQEGLQTALQTAQAQQNLGQTQQQLEQARLQAQQAVGEQEQRLAQAELDQAYNDFVNARDYERQQLAFYNSLLRGIPVPVQQETIRSAPSAGLGTQVAGLGLAGLGAYNAMGGGS